MHRRKWAGSAMCHVNALQLHFKASCDRLLHTIMTNEINMSTKMLSFVLVELFNLNFVLPPPCDQMSTVGLYSFYGDNGNLNFVSFFFGYLAYIFQANTTNKSQQWKNKWPYFSYWNREKNYVHTMRSCVKRAHRWRHISTAIHECIWEKEAIEEWSGSMVARSASEAHKSRTRC